MQTYQSMASNIKPSCSLVLSKGRFFPLLAILFLFLIQFSSSASTSTIIHFSHETVVSNTHLLHFANQSPVQDLPEFSQQTIYVSKQEIITIEEGTLFTALNVEISTPNIPAKNDFVPKSSINKKLNNPYLHTLSSSNLINNKKTSPFFKNKNSLLIFNRATANSYPENHFYAVFYSNPRIKKSKEKHFNSCESFLIPISSFPVAEVFPKSLILIKSLNNHLLIPVRPPPTFLFES